MKSDHELLKEALEVVEGRQTDAEATKTLAMEIRENLSTTEGEEHGLQSRHHSAEGFGPAAVPPTLDENFSDLGHGETQMDDVSGAKPPG